MIFVSHARKDKPVTNPFVDKILRLGFEIRAEHIFYTSHPDTGISGGDYINGSIFRKLLQSKLIVLFLSKNYFDSPYCLCEMGAARLLKEQGKADVFIFLFPGLSYKDMQGVFTENMVVGLDKSGTDSFINMASSVCSAIISDRPAAYTREADEFLKKLSSALLEIAPPKTVSIEEFSKLQTEQAALVAKLSQTGEKNNDLQSYVTKLEELKDRHDVDAIKPRTAQKVEEAYENLLTAIASQLMPLSNSGKRVFFYLWKYGPEEASRRVGQNQLDIGHDVDKNFFCKDGSYYYFASRGDKVKEHVDALNHFFSKDNLVGLCQQYGFQESEWEQLIKNLPVEPMQDIEFWEENCLPLKPLDNLAVFEDKLNVLSHPLQLPPWRTPCQTVTTNRPLTAQKGSPPKMIFLG